MNKLLKYALSSTLLMGVAFADNHVTGEPVKAPVGGDSGGGTAIVGAGGKVSYLGSGKDGGATPLVVVGDDQDKKTSPCVGGATFSHTECDTYKSGATGATYSGGGAEDI